jgi:mRNA-degrading endonuclease RelE of RelBE toxin-antitoxin system
MRDIRFRIAAAKSYKNLAKTQPKVFVWFEKAFKQIAAETYTGLDIKRLLGLPFYRLRIADYRAIFDDNGVVLDIINIAHRREIYC